jgi:hypothetical protein
MTCKTIEQDLALAAANCLDAARLQEIHEHCRGCRDCATRLEQFQHVAAKHSQASKEVDGLVLRYDRSSTRIGQRAATMRGSPLVPVWRWLLPIGAVAAITAAVIWRDQALDPARPQMNPPRVTAALEAPVTRAPSLAVYRNALEKSGDRSLDALLALDADRLLRQTPGQEMRNLRGESF